MTVTLWALLGGLIAFGSFTLVIAEVVARSRADRTVRSVVGRAEERKQLSEATARAVADETVRKFQAEADKIAELAASSMSEQMKQASDEIKRTLVVIVEIWKTEANQAAQAAAEGYAHGLQDFVPSHEDVATLADRLMAVDDRLAQFHGSMDARLAKVQKSLLTATKAFHEVRERLPTKPDEVADPVQDDAAEVVGIPLDLRREKS